MLLPGQTPAHEVRCVAVGTGTCPPDLGDDGLRGPLPDAGNGVRPAPGPDEKSPGRTGLRREQALDVLIEPCDPCFEVRNVVRHSPPQQGLMVAGAARNA